MSRQMAELRRKWHDLRALSAKKTTLWAKRKILQKGGCQADVLPLYCHRFSPYSVACSYRTDAGDQEVGFAGRIR